MNRTTKWILSIVLGATALLLSLQHISEVAQTSPYAYEDPYPFEFDQKASDDLLLFYELLRVENNVYRIHRNLMEVQDEHAHVSTIIFANRYHEFLRYELDELARLLHKGANVVVASEYVEKVGLWSTPDTLLNLDYRQFRNYDSVYAGDALDDELRYTGPNINWHRSLRNVGDEWEVVLSSKSSSRNTDNILIVKKQVGPGTLYVFDSPTLLTNEILVDEYNWKVPFRILDDCYFDYTYFVEYTRIEESEADSDWSPFDWIFENPSLASALWMLIATLSVVYFGKARRRQAVIPTQPEVRNQSVAFNNQVATLYSEKQDHSVILEEALESCLRRIRESRGVEVYIVSQNLGALLQQEAMLPAHCAKQLDTLALMLDKKITISDSDFLHFCKTFREVNELIG